VFVRCVGEALNFTDRIWWRSDTRSRVPQALRHRFPPSFRRPQAGRTRFGFGMEEEWFLLLVADGFEIVHNRAAKSEDCKPGQQVSQSG